MSSVFKGIKKIFKKVVKAIKKIAPIALAVGALVFTGGAALGLSFAKGGWAAAASSLTSSLGSGVLGSAITGAITQAGTAAAIGGIASSIGGGSFSKGARAGAVTGAITGGLLSGYNALRNPAAQAGQGGGVTIDAATGQPIEGGATTFPLPDGAAPPQMTAIDATGTAITPAANVATAPAPRGGGLLSKVIGKGGWIERNPELAGGLIKGVGQGLLSGAAGDDELAYLREQQRLRGANYEGTDPGQNYQTAAPSVGGQAPTDRFNPKSYGSFEYQFDPTVGRIVRVSVGG